MPFYKLDPITEVDAENNLISLPNFLVIQSFFASESRLWLICVANELNDGGFGAFSFNHSRYNYGGSHNILRSTGYVLGRER